MLDLVLSCFPLLDLNRSWCQMVSDGDRKVPDGVMKLSECVMMASNGVRKVSNGVIQLPEMGHMMPEN